MTIDQILAVDPGKATGYVWHRIGDPVPVIIDEANFGDFLLFAEERIAAGGSNLLVVCESFTISAQTLRYSRQPWSLEIIGALKYLATVKYASDLVLQSPANAMRIVPDARLRALGWWVPGKEHARDALRHLALWLQASGNLRLPMPEYEE